MKNTIARSLIAAVAVLCAVSCQKKEPAILDPNAEPPVVGTITLASAGIAYGDTIFVSVPASDAKTLSHILVEVVSNNAVLHSATFPAGNMRQVEVKDTIPMPFGRLAPDMQVEVVVTAINKQAKTASERTSVTVSRPVFQQLYFLTSEETPREITLSPGTGENVFSASIDLPNETAGFIYSETGGKGFQWGMDAATGGAGLGSEEPIVLMDVMAGSVSEIVFNAYDFTVSPLDKPMSINGVAFLPYRRNLTDGSNVSNTLRALNVVVAKGEAVDLEVVDPGEVLFDPDFFDYEDGTLTYTGTSGTVTLYYNTLWEFVFVESQENPISTTQSYPDVLLANGWGIARPELWYYHPDWSFDRAVVFRKVSETATERVYTQTVASHNDAGFRFYSSRDWGAAFDVSKMTFTDDVFKNSGGGDPEIKPNLPAEGQPGWYKSCVVKITLTVHLSGGTITMNNEILVRSDRDS